MPKRRPDGCVRHFVRGACGERAGAARGEWVGQDDVAAHHSGIFAAGRWNYRSKKTPSPCPSPARGEGTPSQRAQPAPSPLAGEGWGEGGTLEGVYHYIGHANGIKPRLSVIENVSFWQSYYSGAEDIEAAEEALEAFALLNLASFSAGHLSQGQARRLGLARLLAARRPVWLLDEPQAALDTASTRLLERAIAAHLSSGGLAIVSTHLDLALPDAQILELGTPQFVQ